MPAARVLNRSRRPLRNNTRLADGNTCAARAPVLPAMQPENAGLGSGTLARRHRPVVATKDTVPETDVRGQASQSHHSRRRACVGFSPQTADYASRAHCTWVQLIPPLPSRLERRGWGQAASAEMGAEESKPADADYGTNAVGRRASRRGSKQSRKSTYSGFGEDGVTEEFTAAMQEALESGSEDLQLVSTPYAVASPPTLCTNS